jgi:DNA (cytosine-5)-methyltransferase 1
MDQLVLSLFPGVDLLGRGFEAEGFAVVRGPDLITGGDVRRFHVPAGRFDGVIGGSPCQDFSRARRTAPTGEGLELLGHYARVVLESSALWFLLENVPGVPDLVVDGYVVQRFDLNARECGMRQQRLRHFQFGSRLGLVVVPERREPVGLPELIALATEGERVDRRSWADFCELQGLPRDFELPGMSISAKYRAVGNGVPIPMARVIARAICSARSMDFGERLCVCGCGRVVAGRHAAALPACRKRLERRRKGDRLAVFVPGPVTVAESRFAV